MQAVMVNNNKHILADIRSINQIHSIRYISIANYAVHTCILYRVNQLPLTGLEQFSHAKRPS